MTIEMKNISKSYGPLLANNNVGLTLGDKEILAVVGENGAGKSTLMKILYGLEQCDSGDIFINGKKESFRSPHDAIQKGIGMVQQHFMLFQSMTAAENIVYGREPVKHGLFDRKKAVQIVTELCKTHGLHIDPDVNVEDCPVGVQQRIEILKVLYQGAHTIIFDEPSAVLTPPEVLELLQTIRDLKNGGKSVILITHKLNEVMAVADRVTVMRQGKVVKHIKTEETSIEELSYLMVGYSIQEKKIAPVSVGEACLNIQHLTLAEPGRKAQLDDLSLHVQAGEIVGIAGVSGNGQSELARCIAGLCKYQAGQIRIANKDITGKSVEAIREAGCAYIPEDRYLWGSAKDATLDENCVMSHYHKTELMKRGFFHTAKVQAFSNNLLKSYDVRHTSLRQCMSELSGGNAQKLIVAREIHHKAPLLIAAEPTRGIDIGAIEYIHDKLLEIREKGGGILLVSSELSEILELSDRIYVLYCGKIAGEFSRKDATAEKIGFLMMGGKSDAQAVH